MEYPSKKIEAAVNELASLPGIGRKTALRLALHILKQSEGAAEKLGESIIEMRKGVKFCKECGNISDDDICKICSNPRRNAKLVCVVEDAKDVIAKIAEEAAELSDAMAGGDEDSIEDEFGDLLANGTYLYRVQLRSNNGTDFNRRGTSKDGAFNNGFGKLVIIR